MARKTSASSVARASSASGVESGWPYVLRVEVDADEVDVRVACRQQAEVTPWLQPSSR
ncbi:MAG: hypothetical protein N2557_08365 [Hydrogenophilus sp.]|nr:hypothetical protein [Hydrogenophilus sp.]